ncbi:MAG TPA: SPOR domain-containing protein [Methylocystis sp.]|nr:SPOR domain-containing protein [Methylocystis sp.]
MREAIKRGAPIEIEEFERRLRNQEARRASLGDPLRELARLMQDQEHDETAQRYERIFDGHGPSTEGPESDFGFHPDALHEAAAAAEEDFVPHPGWQEPAPHSVGDNLPPPLRGSFSEEPDQQDVAPERADWGRRLAAPADFGAQHHHDFYPEDYGQAHPHAPAPGEDAADYGAFEHAQAGEYYSDDHGAYEDYSAAPYAESQNEQTERVRRSFRVKPWHAVALAGLVGALGVGWGIARIKGVAGSREIATIAAPSGPTKVAPAVADSSQTAKEDVTVLDRGVETPVRNVVPHQEAPVEPVVEPPREPSAQTYRRVKTVAIHEDSSLNPAKAPAAVERAASDAPAAAPAAATTTPPNAAPPATTAQTAQKQPAVKKVAAAPSPAPARAAAPVEAAKTEEAVTPDTQAEPPRSGSAFIQFGAAPNESEARALAKKVVQKYGSRLGGRKPTWKTAEVGDKTVYRVRVGGLSREAAASLCKSVKSDGGDCYVANK